MTRLATFTGYAGAALLALCSAPLLVQTLEDGHARGVSLGFLLAWWFGEVLMLAHVAVASRTAPLVANYLANVAIVGVILWYRVARP